MDIAVFRPFFPPWEMEVYLRLAEKHTVTFYITSPERGNPYAPFLSKAEDPSVKTLQSNRELRRLMDQRIVKRFFTVRFAYFDGGVFPNVFTELMKNNYQVVDTIETYTYSSLQSSLAKRLDRSRLVVTSFENIPWSWRRYIVARKAVMYNTDAFIVHSHTAEKKLLIEGYPPERICFLPCAVNIEKLHPKQTSSFSEKLKLDGPVVLYLGRISAEKGLSYLIQAFKSVLKEKPETKLVIFGEGSEKQILIELSHKLDISKSIVFPGPIPHSEIQEAFALAEVFVLPSIPTATWQEQFGYVLIEGMSCGKPAIASRIGSIPEIIDDSINGLLVSPKDVNALASAIISMLSDPAKVRNMGLNARKKVVETYADTVVVEDLIKVYSEIL